jgi:hypothetical protein
METKRGEANFIPVSFFRIKSHGLLLEIFGYPHALLHMIG